MKQRGLMGLMLLACPAATTLFFPSFILTFFSHVQSTAVDGKQAYVCIFFFLSFSSSPAVPNKEMFSLCQKITSTDEDFAKVG
jgi:hypothetical protein